MIKRFYHFLDEKINDKTRIKTFLSIAISLFLMWRFLVFSLATFIFYRLSVAFPRFADFFQNGPARVLRFLFAKATNAFPFSLAEALLLCVPVALLVLIVLFVIKELFQLIAGIVTFRKGRMLKGALISGKISTAVLFISLIYLVIFHPSEYVAGVLTIIDGTLLLIAFADYFRTYYQNTSMIEDLPADDDK